MWGRTALMYAAGRDFVGLCRPETKTEHNLVAGRHRRTDSAWVNSATTQQFDHRQIELPNTTTDPDHSDHPDKSAQRRKVGETMYAAIMQITIYLMAVLAPVLLPAIVHAVHVVRDRKETFGKLRAVRLPQATASRAPAFGRLAVPAAA
jgi:hypothetical protein